MPRALVASALPAGWQPRSTSPPLVATAASHSSSASTLIRPSAPNEDGHTNNLAGAAPSPRSTVDAVTDDHNATGAHLPRPSSVGSVGRGINTLMARRPSIFTDEDDEGPEGRQAALMSTMAASGPSRSSPPLSRMSLSSVGGLSSINAPDPAALPSPSPAKQRPPLATVVNSDKGHRTMLSSGSVRSFGGRSRVSGQRSPSPPLPRPQGQPVPAAATTAKPPPEHHYDASLDGYHHSTISTSAAAAAPPGPVDRLLKGLLPPAVARYPHAPGHETPRAFEEGCSKPPSPRPANHYRHRREGGGYTLSDDVHDAIEEALSPLPNHVQLASENTPTRPTGTARHTPSEDGQTPSEYIRPTYPPLDTRLSRPTSLYTRTSFPVYPYPTASHVSTSQTSPAQSPDFSPPLTGQSSPTIYSKHHALLSKSHSFVHSGNANVRSIASAIRERRLQASSMSSASLTELLTCTPESMTVPLSTSMTEQRRTRSRRGTRMGGISDLSHTMDFGDFARDVTTTTTAATAHPSSVRSSHSRPKSGLSDGSARDSFARALQHSIDLDSFGEVVMTPTTEEWRYLGGVPGKMRKFHDEPDEFEEDDDEEDADANDSDEVEMEGGEGALGLDLGDRASEEGRELETQYPPTPEPPSFFADTKSTLARATMAYVPVQGILELDVDAKSVPILNAMSTQSIMSEETDMTSSSIDLSPRFTRNRTLGHPTTSCSLSHEGVVRGPIDPRTYSAYTLARDINSFVIEGEAGQGAYGTVKRAREKGIDGHAIGPPLIIKYIVKQKILADCWKKHKVLGPIPIEIHVLDHLRRVSYRPSVIATTAKSHRRPPSRRTSLFGLPTSPLSPTLSIMNADPLAHMIPRTGHPNICGILDYFEDIDYYYLVMPCFGEGQDLFDYVDLAPDGLPIHEVRSIFGQVADATAFLHEHNIVHRDIKDENVIMDGFGNVQLIDFGSAAYVKEGKNFDTFSGTLDFAAPEVLRGERHGGKEIDVWALGVLFYVLLCGECPFWNASECSSGVMPSSRARNALDTKCHIIRQSMGSMEAATGSRDEVNPEDAVDLIARCLALEARHRPSAHEVCQHRFLVGPGGWSGAVL